MIRKLNILLVEDEVLSAMVMTSKLQNFGYNVTRQVTTGEESVSVMKEELIDVVLMDIRLAGNIDGIEAASQIRKISIAPIIFLTGYHDNETRNRAEVIFPLAYLTKPVDMKILKKYLEDLC